MSVALLPMLPRALVSAQYNSALVTKSFLCYSISANVDFSIVLSFNHRFAPWNVNHVASLSLNTQQIARTLDLRN